MSEKDLKMGVGSWEQVWGELRHVGGGGGYTGVKVRDGL